MKSFEPRDVCGPILVVALGWLITLGGCQEPGPSEPHSSPWSGVSVSVEPGEATLELGFTHRFRVISEGRHDSSTGLPPVRWVTNDSTVATVDSTGVVIARGPGDVRIEVLPTDPDSPPLAAARVTVPPLRFRQVSAGNTYTCAITEGERAYCWGNNFLGMLGIGIMGGSSTIPTPVDFPGTDTARFSSVSAKYRHSCALSVHGDAYCWGRDSAVPERVPGQGLSFESISAGGWFTCALRTDGRAYCWGRNRVGSLGDGTGVDSDVPVPVAGGLTFSSIRTGGQTACGVTVEGIGYCWGLNSSANEDDSERGGHVGDGTRIDRFEPSPVAGGHLWRVISPGVGYTCGVTAEGVAYCWGNDYLGKLGLGTSERRPYLTPMPVATDLRFEDVQAATLNTCGLTTDGVVYCWGQNGWGHPLGRPHQEMRNSDVPVRIRGDHIFRWISKRGPHACGLASDDLVYCWGANPYGNLGIGVYSYGSPEPRPVFGQKKP